MKLILTGLALVVVTGIAVAQSLPTQAPPAVQSAAITVTGCLQSGASASGDSAPFVLTKVIARTDAQEPSPKPTGAAGAGTPGPANAPAGTTGSTPPVSQYIVHGSNATLAKHAGNRVEIVGTASMTPPVPAGAPDTQVIPHEPQRGPVSTVAAPGGELGTAHPSVQHLSVQSMKMIAAGCQ